MELANWLDPCFELAAARLNRFDWTQEERPDIFKKFEHGDGDKSYLMTSAGWLEERKRLNLRWTRLQGAKLDIATLMCYPTNRPDLLPVFAFEWVVVGGRGHAMVCDVEPCGSQSDLEKSLDYEFSSLFNDSRKTLQEREKPDWFKEIARPHALFFSVDLPELPKAFQVQDRYLALTMERYYHPLLTEQLDGGPDNEAVIDYKIHHAHNSPGAKMLEKWFGKEQAEEFLYRFHFGPSGETDQPPRTLSLEQALAPKTESIPSLALPGGTT